MIAALLIGACGHRSAPPPATDDRHTTPPPAPPPADAASMVDAAPAVAPADAAVAVAPTTGGARGDYCDADADCAWDDPCSPTRCGTPPPAAVDCGKTVPPPGTCACVEQQCTIRLDHPERATSAPGCTGDRDCAIDVGGGACQLGGPGSIGPIHEQGPLCTCAAGSGRCQWSWVGPIPCKSWRDCSWTHEPRLRPVSSRQVPRPVARPVRPCRDGEVDSVCTDHTCRIVGWRC